MKFTRSRRKQPLFQLHMAPTDEGICVRLMRDGLVLKRDALDSPVVQERVPALLLSFLKTESSYEDGDYVMPLPIAQGLYKQIEPQVSTSFQIKYDAVSQLQVIDRPEQFHIEWHYDAKDRLLKRHLQGAKHYLGMGWFQKGGNIWLLDETAPEELLRLLESPTISANQLYGFVTDFYALVAETSLPLSCTFQIKRDFDPALEIVKMRQRSLDVRFHPEHGQLLRDVEPLSDDSDHMISGHILLPHLRPVLRPKLLEIARAGKIVRLRSDELPAFIQDELRPYADLLNVDMNAIDDAYPLVSAARLKRAWQLEYKRVCGVGRYQASPYLAWGANIIPERKFMRAITTGHRFLPLDEGWVEFSQVAKERLLKDAKRGFRGIKITAHDMLQAGERGLAGTGLQLPTIRPQSATDEAQTAHNFADAMRHHGLPVALTGLQDEMSDILFQICTSLYADYAQARVLWIVPRKKRKDVLVAMRKATDHLSLAQIESIIVTTPEAMTLHMGQLDWTLVIFHELDNLAANRRAAPLLARSKWRWSVATFAKPNWYQSALRLETMMAAIKLTVQDVKPFRDKCVRDFTDQNPGILTRLVSPFKRILFGEADESSNDASTSPAKIPPRSISDTDSPSGKENVWSQIRIEDVDQVHRPSFAIPQRTHRPRETFLEQASKFVDRAEPQADPVPFAQPLPTYAEMTDAQQQWYFYWRSQVRQGKFVDTDLSYILVHIYEAINLIGFDTSQAAFDHLVQLWQEYRVRQPKLDRTLVHWLADFTVVHPVVLNAVSWYAQALTEGYVIDNPDLLMESWLRTDGNFELISNDLLYRMASYNPTKNRFYQSHSTEMDLDAAYKRGVQAVDSYIRQTEGKSLFEIAEESGVGAIRRSAFDGALHEYREHEIEIVRTRQWLKNQALAGPLRDIIKQSENILRERAQYRTKLRGIDLPQPWLNAIQETFVEAEPRREIEIDMGSVATLTRESEAIRQRLIVEAETDEVVVASPSTPLSNVTSLANGDSNKVENVIPTIQDELPEELAEIADVISMESAADSDEKELKLLRLLQQQNWEVSSTQLAVAVEDDFVSVTLDQLNERAYNVLGDVLLFDEGDVWVVNEEYRKEATRFLDYLDATANESSNVLDEKQQETTAFKDINGVARNEWTTFAATLLPHHWDTLNGLINSTASHESLERIAQGIHSTASQLIDELNEYALESIGDILIDTTDAVPALNEEHLEELQALMNRQSVSPPAQADG